VLGAKGARPRWNAEDTDAANIVQVTFGRLSWNDRVTPPVNAGVRGVLTVLSSSQPLEPPMSFDFSPDWTVTVRVAHR